MKPGDVFGRLKVLSVFSRKTPTTMAGRKFKTRGMAECVCACGKTMVAARSDIRSGHTTSCGCYRREVTIKSSTTHGMSKDPAYRLWAGVKARCTIPSASNYSYYGGRGISMCDAWMDDPEKFIDWAYRNGYQQGLEIDRIDNDGDYEPENCRFVSHMENSQKSRIAGCTIEQAAEAKKLLNAGLPVADSAKKAGVSYMTAWHIKSGYSWRNA